MIEQHLAHIAGLEKKFGRDSEEVAVALRTLAGLICKYGESEDGVPFFERCIAIRESLTGPASVLPDLDDWLGQNVRMSFAAREPFLLKRIEIKVGTSGELQPDVADECASLASVYLNRNQLTEARTFLERSLAIREKLDGAHDPNVVATLEKLVDVCLRAKKREQADRYLERCDEASEAAFGARAKERAATLVSLATILISSGTSERKVFESDAVRKARPLFERAFSIYEELFGPDSLEVQKALETISRACLEFGEFSPAKPLLKRLLSICERIYGDDAAALLWILSELAQGYAEAGSMEAEPMLERSYEVLRHFLDARKPIVRHEINDLPGNAEVLYRGRGGLVERLVRTSERIRSNTRTRWGG